MVCLTSVKYVAVMPVMEEDLNVWTSHCHSSNSLEFFACADWYERETTVKKVWIVPLSSANTAPKIPETEAPHDEEGKRVEGKREEETPR